VTTATTTLSKNAMTASDRCDRCGAQAYVRVQLNAGGELLFCAHHGREHRDALRAAGADIHDESQKLAATSSTATLDER
jgi:ribosomal protein L37E